MGLEEVHVWIFQGMTPMSKGPKEKTVPGGTCRQGSAKRLWRIGGPNIPCQVASPQSLTPFLRVRSTYSASFVCRNDLWTSEACLRKSIGLLA